MISYGTDATIQSSASKVFQLLTDASRFGEWTEMRDSRMVGEPGVGARIETVLKMGPWTLPSTFEVTEWDEGRKFSVKTVSSGRLSWDGGFSLEPAGESGTHITSIGTVGFHGWMRLLEPLVAGEVRRGEAKELERLKGILEAAA